MKKEKICRTCNKVFTWRKKWKRDWINVLYCSERCRKNKLKIGKNIKQSKSFIKNSK